MWPADLMMGFDLLTTSADRQAILERLYERQAIRRERGVRPIRVTEVYHRKVRKLTEDRYDMLLQPYIDAAFSKIEWPNSYTGRILLGAKVYKECTAQCEADTGIANPHKRYPDIVKIINCYAEPLI